MSIKQVLYKDIPRNIYKKFWSFSIPPGEKDIFFKIEDVSLGEHELWELVKKIEDQPKGVDIEAIGQYHLRVSYWPSEITEESLINFIKSLNFIFRQ